MKSFNETNKSSTFGKTVINDEMLSCVSGGIPTFFLLVSLMNETPADMKASTKSVLSSSFGKVT